MLAAGARLVNAAAVHKAVLAVVATLAALAIPAPAATAAAPFNGIIVEARLIKVDTTTASATMRIDAAPSGSYARDDTNLLSRDVVLYTTATTGALAHPYRAGDFLDPFETTVPLEGATSTYPFHHLKVEVAALAATGGGVRSGKPVPLQLHIASSVAGYRVSPSSGIREGSALVHVTLHVDPSWATVAFVVFIMAVMWALALCAIAVVVNLVGRRRRFEGAFTAFLAALLFAFPTVRNTLPGVPPVGALFDYAAFFWAEALVALALIALITGWTLRALVGTGERRD